jgi:hypothetical protein
MTTKRRRGTIEGFLNRYAEWRKRRLAASCEAPLKNYLLKMGFTALCLVADFLLLPSFFFSFLPVNKATVIILAAILVPIIFTESKMLNRGSAGVRGRRA